MNVISRKYRTELSAVENRAKRSSRFSLGLPATWLISPSCGDTMAYGQWLRKTSMGLTSDARRAGM
jgi:hypothetical protein